MEPLPSVGVDILPTDLSSPGSFLPEFSSSSQSGDFGTGGQSSSPELFVSKVLEDPIGRSTLAGRASSTIFGEQREVVFPVRKKPKFI